MTVKFTRYAALTLTLLAAWACTDISAQTSESAENPKSIEPPTPMNVVFIEVDDLTQKWVGAFGAKHIQTPAIDKLAREGVRFQNAVAQGTMCAPSRNSLITGLYPRNIGLYANGMLRQLPNGIWAFPQALQDSGFHTAYLGKSHLRPPLGGVDRKTDYRKNAAMIANLGFDESSSYPGRAVVMRSALQMKEKKKGWKHGGDIYADYLYDKGLIDRFISDKKKVSTLEPDDYLDGYIRNDASKWISNYDGDKPFFLWVNFSAPHGPYDAPGDWIQKYSPKDTPPLIVDKDKSDIPDVMLSHKWTKGKAATGEQRAEYAGMISYLDSQVGQVVKTLDEQGLRENTMIVFFSDQGVMEGDHGLAHKYTLYDEIILPSLIVTMPGASQGTVVTQPAELLDLVPTVMDAAGVPDASRGPDNGYSLLPLLQGTGPFDRQAAYAELYDAVAMVTDSWKYIESSQGNVLFDRRNDPDELRNVITENPKIATDLAGRMQTWRDGPGGTVLPVSEKQLARLVKKQSKGVGTQD